MIKINNTCINEAITHVLDEKSDTPIFNEYKLELNEDLYSFLLKHIEKVFKNKDFKYGKFKNNSTVKRLSQRYLTGSEELKPISKQLAEHMFAFIKEGVSSNSSDIIFVSISTEDGPMLGILKMDYDKNYTHNINFVDEKISIDIVRTNNLPKSVQKSAFISIYKEDYELLILDKNKKSSPQPNWFTEKYLEAYTINNNSDLTQKLFNSTEQFIRNNYVNDAAAAEEIRNNFKKEIKEHNIMKINDLPKKLFSQSSDYIEPFQEFIHEHIHKNEFEIDKELVDKKFKNIKLKLENNIEVTLSENIYNDPSKFQIEKNSDGSINVKIKNVSNYIEK